MQLRAEKRIISIEDDNSFQEWDRDCVISLSLNDYAYEQKVLELNNKYGLRDAVVTGQLKILNQSAAVGIMDTRFMMASMGQVVGEKITRLFERAIKKKLPVIIFCCSAGARMQEGIISLMQMEKTSAAVKKHDEAGLLYISVLTNPTLGGVCASYAMIADIVLAEKEAKIGFAGSRVIEQNTCETLPEGYQTAEFQMTHGFVDNIVEYADLKEYLGKLLKMHNSGSFKKKIHKPCKTGVYVTRGQKNLDAWEKVRIARSHKRPTSLDFINKLFEDFEQLHGDRISGDDPAIIGGIACIGNSVITVIAHQKGKADLQEAVYRNWGMAMPKGYRKALRLMKQADKFGRPIICIIDTVGAACGKEAEEQGQGVAIANILKESSRIGVPTLSIIIGEGGSGGALALGVGNEVWMLEHAVYSILSPEGYASIIWKDSTKAEEAARIMNMQAHDLYKLGIVDKVIPEPDHLTLDNMDEVCLLIKNEILLFMERYRRKTRRFIARSRYNRFRKY